MDGDRSPTFSIITRDLFLVLLLELRVLVLFIENIWSQIVENLYSENLPLHSFLKLVFQGKNLQNLKVVDFVVFFIFDNIVFSAWGRKLGYEHDKKTELSYLTLISPPFWQQGYWTVGGELEFWSSYFGNHVMIV